ncbi:unnamed protein product [Clavelina lepadiformis]|uniref:Uncharacterized protein n=1 Tax=Clavelina lepadiformis TaxID=159417 RepID=A0ABP0GW81_CLALP
MQAYDMMTKKRVLFIVILLIGFLSLFYSTTFPACTNINGSTTSPQHVHEERKRMKPVTSYSVQELRRMTIKTACQSTDSVENVFNKSFVNPTNICIQRHINF